MAACPEDLQMTYRERSRDDKLEMAMSDFVLTLLFGRIENRLRNYPRSETTIQKLLGPTQKLRLRNYLHRFKKLRRFRNCDSETIWTDSETMIQKLFAPIQQTAPIQKLRFRNYFARFRNYNSETISPDSENTIQKLLRQIYKRFRSLNLAI